MPTDPVPAAHPIVVLATIIDGLLEATQRHYAALRRAAAPLPAPQLARLQQIFTAQRDDLWLYEEQLALWTQMSLTPSQQREIARLAGQVAEIRAVTEALLGLLPGLAEEGQPILDFGF